MPPRTPAPSPAVKATPPNPTPNGTPTNGATTTKPPPAPAALDADRKTLVALHEATGGLIWSKNKNWMSTADGSVCL